MLKFSVFSFVIIFFNLNVKIAKDFTVVIKDVQIKKEKYIIKEVPSLGSIDNLKVEVVSSKILNDSLEISLIFNIDEELQKELKLEFIDVYSTDEIKVFYCRKKCKAVRINNLITEKFELNKTQKLKIPLGYKYFLLKLGFNIVKAMEINGSVHN